MHKSFRLVAFTLVALVGCHSSHTKVTGDGGSGPFYGPDGGIVGQLTIAPTAPTIAVSGTTITPSTVQFTAKAGGATVSPSWAVDRGEIGVITSTGLFTPSGTTAGVANITATFGTQTATTTVTVTITATQNGDPAFGSTAPVGAGGYGGVGGNGPGGTVTPAQQTTLNGPATVDATVVMLYPYDQTVWPRGMLAPLLMWRPGAHAFDSVYVHIQEANYEYKGYFSAPNSAAFVNLPIPQAAWQAATYSNSGDTMKVTITFAQGTTAYGPYTLNWKISRGGPRDGGGQS